MFQIYLINHYVTIVTSKVLAKPSFKQNAPRIINLQEAFTSLLIPAKLNKQVKVLCAMESYLG